MPDFKNVSKDSKISGKKREKKSRSKKKIDFITKKFKLRIKEMSMGITQSIQVRL